MKNKLLSNSVHGLGGVLSLLQFIFLSGTYLTVREEQTGWFEVFDRYTHFSGYKLMSAYQEYETTWLEDEPLLYAPLRVCGVIQVLILVLSIAMLLYYVYNLLNKLDIIRINLLPKALCKTPVARIGLIAYCGLHFVLLIGIAAFNKNSTTVEDAMSFLTTTLKLGAGWIWAFIIGISAVLASFVLPRLALAKATGNAPSISYLCTSCGKSARKGVKFCTACGGAVREKTVYPTVFVCSNCGKRAKAGVKFCTDCGGSIVETIPTTTVHVCVNCGKQVKPGIHFCPDCGGRVEAKRVRAS